MRQFNLTEAYDYIYAELAEEQLKEDINSLIELSEDNNNQMTDALDILKECLLTEAPFVDNESGSEKKSESKGATVYKAAEEQRTSSESELGKLLDMYDKMQDRANKRITNSKENGDYGTYQPVNSFVQIEKISDMKFPQNILFFISQLVKWIKNNILNFIDKFSNIVRSLLGMKVGESKFRPEDLKFRLDKAKEIETKYIFNNGKDAYGKDTKFSNVLSGEHDYVANVKPVSLFNLDSKDLKIYEDLNVFAGAENFVELTEAPLPNTDPNSKNAVQAIRIDTSKELFELNQSLQHFFELFDDAFGSNDEKLFGVDDLELMLQLFKKTIEEIKTPNKQAYEIRGNLSYGAAINPTNLKDNLLRTKINTDNLKRAYVVTNEQINVIAKVIMNKNMIGALNMGAQYAFLSASTYEYMIELITVVDSRIKEASEMEKKLKKMKTAYENLTKTLEKYRTSLAAVSGLVVTTALQRRIEDLYDGSRYMTQTVQLRLNALALYLSELNDTRAILKNLNAIPESAMKQNKGMFQKIKELFKK